MKTPLVVPPILVALMMVTAFGCGRSRSVPTEAVPRPDLANGTFTAVVDGRSIRYEVVGDGPVLMVLTNSWGLGHEGLRELLRPLTERLKVVTFDPRGIGGSSPIVEAADMGLAAVRADFNALRSHLGLASVNALGWSNGATNLILLAAEHPETIDTAIFVHGVASFGPADFMAFAERYPEITQRYVAFQQEMVDETLTDDERTARMREMWLGEYFPAITADPATAGPAIRAAFADADFSWPHAQYATQESPAFDLRDRLGSITARSLVVAGAHDSLPSDKVREIADGIADASFVLFESSGHFAPIEEPERFAETVFAFLGVSEAPTR